MELFTLGSGYSEHDIREAARALTGFRTDWPDSGPPRYFYDADAHDGGVKRIFGQRGRFDWRDVLRLVVAHPRHAGFMVEKLWNHFVATPIPRATKQRLARTYVASGHDVRPVVAAILAHPALYRRLDAPDMVKCPVVYVAGALRMTGDHVRIGDWTWLLSQMGQLPFDPPSVAGWEWGPAWLSSNAMKVRHGAVNYLTETGPLRVRDKTTPKTLKPAEAVRRAWRACGEPWMSSHTHRAALALATHMLRGSDRSHGYMDLQTRQDHTQRALRQLLLGGPDGQVC
jgi:uncharacterized protein (DUF1800 family)